MLKHLAIITALNLALVPAIAADKTSQSLSAHEPASFPTETWSGLDESDPFRRDIQKIIGSAFTQSAPQSLRKTKAIVVVCSGKIVAERYATGIDPSTRLQSWSMAKSILHAALGIAIKDGLIDPDQPAPVIDWQSTDDPRRRITARQLAQMTDGLDFAEDYGDPSASVMQMLFGAGRTSVGEYAIQTPLKHNPGEHWNYSSGSANILSHILREKLGGAENYREFLKKRLFAPIGMKSAVAEFDAAGTWIASSYVHATARDYAKFGLLYLRKGMWETKQIIPSEWVQSASKPSLASLGQYGTLFWLNAGHPQLNKRAISNELPEDLYFARGFGGQLIAIVPSLDALLVMANANYTDEVKSTIELIARVIAAIERQTVK